VLLFKNKKLKYASCGQVFNAFGVKGMCRLLRAGRYGTIRVTAGMDGYTGAGSTNTHTGTHITTAAHGE
jgi:hypothetical protein